MDIQTLMREAHETAKAKGWWDEERVFPELIALAHSELSEALEDYRKWGMDVHSFLTTFDDFKPVGIAAEFADVLIRIADTCEKYGIPLVEALVAKLAFNKSRPYRHGGKVC